MTSYLLLAALISSSDQPAARVMSEADCGGIEAPIVADAPGAVILGRCEQAGLAATLHISVSAADPHQLRGAVESFTLGFCGEIVGAVAPADWRVTISRKTAALNQPTVVEWAVVDSFTGGPATARIDGFEVVLGARWRLAGTYTIRWQNSGAGGGFFGHKCAELPDRKVPPNKPLQPLSGSYF